MRTTENDQRAAGYVCHQTRTLPLSSADGLELRLRSTREYRSHGSDLRRKVRDEDLQVSS